MYSRRELQHHNTLRLENRNRFPVGRIHSVGLSIFSGSGGMSLARVETPCRRPLQDEHDDGPPAENRSILSSRW